jgi:Spy/CpxP family protein refolding chaperone
MATLPLSGVSCGHGPSRRTTGDARTEIALVSDLASQRHRHSCGGALVPLAVTLDALSLPAERRVQIARIALDLVAKMRREDQAGNAVLTLLARGVSATKIDRQQVEAALAKLATASAAVHEAAPQALNELHALLAPSERKALATTLDGRRSLWTEVSLGARNDDQTLADDLGLTDNQREKVSDDLPLLAKSPAEREAEIEAFQRAFHESFANDVFEARTLPGAAGANGWKIEWSAADLAHFCEDLNPLLSIQQRRALIGVLRRHSLRAATPRPL